MVRFAVQFPNMLLTDPSVDFNGNRATFIKQCKPVIYWPNFKYRFTRGSELKKHLKQSSIINVDEYEFAFSVSELNRKADVLINFNEYPINFEHLMPPKGFNGLKVWHIYEYVFYASQVNKMLVENGVDYLLGYADHGKYCPFFQQYYSGYIDKVIPFPFGTTKRFMVDELAEPRIQKVIALGSVNQVNEPGLPSGVLTDYSNFYAHKIWTHEWRRMLAENEAKLASVMDSQLPHFPEMKNTAYNAVEMMTRYAMFANDEGLLAFPPARTFEGPAAGSVMISSDHGCFKDLGFVDGVNCIMHNKHDIDDFKSKATYFIDNPDKLKSIAAAGKQLIYDKYTHIKVAEKLAAQLGQIHSTGKIPE